MYKPTFRKHVLLFAYVGKELIADLDARLGPPFDRLCVLWTRLHPWGRIRHHISTSFPTAQHVMRRCSCDAQANASTLLPAKFSPKQTVMIVF